MNGKRAPLRLKSLSQELLLFSGQFALYYLAMQFIIDGNGLLTNASHLGLTAALIVQTAVLSKYGEKTVFRLLFSFIVPVAYSLIELTEGTAYLINAAHIGFWVYAIASSVLMVFKINGDNRKSRAAEIALVVANVAIFVFLYFYFDTWKELNGNKEELTILRIFSHAAAFLSDPTHWFIIWGGAILAMTVAIGRNEIALLKEKIYSLFGKYVDGRIRDLIIEEGKMESRRLELCVLFSDIKDFTGLCERNDPKPITELLNLYFERWNVFVEKYGGIVDKYIGDAIMVIFGLSGEAGACDAAVRCGIEMDAYWENLKNELAERKLPVPAGFGIGCHFGDVILGDIGSSDRKNFTVIGDTVNVASRLEAASRLTKSRLLISSAVYERLSAEIARGFGQLGRIKVKGKEAAISVWMWTPPA